MSIKNLLFGFLNSIKMAIVTMEKLKVMNITTGYIFLRQQRELMELCLYLKFCLKTSIEISHRWHCLPLICPLKIFFGLTKPYGAGRAKKFFQWANQGQTAPFKGKFLY
ncbi:unnamed protein product [Blepharisma stoltei]|uniref:Uncharacterized protein n=1 Tax=Blepharisma stoltei TaxID=1481888 RepID=A0AAU9J961_9CILI|nr:unnamed protein product [Blepharisma stoltei]